MKTGRARLRLVAGAAVVAAVVAVAGCGLASSTGAPGTGAGSPPTQAAKVSLTITVTNGPGSKPVHWTLRCDPAGGTHPDPARTCGMLLAVKNPFAPRPIHVMCPMIMESSRQAVVTGTWFGRPVNRVVIDGGCDLGLWSKIGPIFS